MPFYVKLMISLQEAGRLKPRANTFDWEDAQRLLFSWRCRPRIEVETKTLKQIQLDLERPTTWVAIKLWMGFWARNYVNWNEPTKRQKPCKTSGGRWIWWKHTRDNGQNGGLNTVDVTCLFFPWVGWLEKWAYPTCKSLMPFTSIGRFHFYFTIFTAERWMNCLLQSQEPTSIMQTCNPLPFEIWSLNRVFSVFRVDSPALLL